MKRMMKRMTAMTFATLFALLLLTPGALADGGEGAVTYVYNPDAADRLNLRTSPDKDAPSIAKYYTGAQIVPLGGERDGWVFVSTGLLDGYMDATYLRTAQDESDVISAMPTVTIANGNGTGANLRMKPGEDGRVIRTIPNGERVTVKGVTPEWLHVIAGDNEGFIMAGLATPRIAFDRTQQSAVQPGDAVIDNPNPADRLNLRAAPRKDAVSLGKYYTGARVRVLGEEAGGWIFVSTGLLEGYMDASYLRTGSEASGVVSAMPTVTVRNNGGTGANLRTKPGEDGRVIRLLSNGTKVTVKGLTEDWLHVIAGEDEGFIRIDLATPRLYFGQAQDGGVDDGGDVLIVSTTSASDRLNLRTEPNSNAPSLCKYYRGVEVTLLSDEGNGWYYVDIAGMRGYVKAEFIARGTRAQAQAMSATPTVTALHNNMPVYDQMNYDSGRVTTLSKGEAVTVLGVSTDYLHVRTASGAVGFVLIVDMTPKIEFDLKK